MVTNDQKRTLILAFQHHGRSLYRPQPAMIIAISPCSSWPPLFYPLLAKLLALLSPLATATQGIPVQLLDILTLNLETLPLLIYYPMAKTLANSSPSTSPIEIGESECEIERSSLVSTSTSNVDHGDIQLGRLGISFLFSQRKILNELAYKESQMHWFLSIIIYALIAMSMRYSWVLFQF